MQYICIYIYIERERERELWMTIQTIRNCEFQISQGLQTSEKEKFFK